jgi:predicted Ser/Thr protein kinase
MKDLNLSIKLEKELQQSLSLPSEIKLLDFIGRGRRSFAYKAKYNGELAVIKIYRDEYIKKYFNKCNIDIAEFEFERNTKLYNIEKIRQYIAKPYKVFSKTSAYTHSFVQEFIEGITLKQLISELGYLPIEVLEAGYEIVRNAESNNIHDLDISVGNILVVKQGEIWLPKLYDFNILPQHMNPPNIFLATALRCGLRKKSYRDYRSLKNWERRGKQKYWIGRN